MNILEKIKEKKLVSRYSVLILSLFISACYFNLLQFPTKIVTGGSQGVSIIINSYFGLDPSIIIFVISFLLLLLGFIFLGIDKTAGAIVSTIIYPIFIRLTSNIGDYIAIDLNDKVLLSIFIGVFSGVTTGMVYKVGFSNGGFAIISEIISKYKKISISTTSFIINLIIVVLGGASFGWNMVMYAIIVLYIYSVVLDKVLIGVSKNKAVYIITDKDKKIRDYIIKDLKIGLTMLDVTSGYQNKESKVIMTVIPNRDYFKLKENIEKIDNNVFFIVTDAYQVYGGKL